MYVAWTLAWYLVRRKLRAWKFSECTRSPSSAELSESTVETRRSVNAYPKTCVSSKSPLFADRNSVDSGTEYAGVTVDASISSMANSRTHSSRWASLAAISSYNSSGMRSRVMQ